MKKKGIRTILAIDTSCDDTSVAITDGTRILANIISSQDELHNKWGGIVPDIARRAHKERINYVIDKSFKRASRNTGRPLSWKDIDAIAVTYGPGLAIALEVGLTSAKSLAEEHSVPILAVNHMEGHLLSSLAANLKGKAPVELKKNDFPVLGMLVSGGHTELVLMNTFGDYRLVAETLDDAVGEAYDKVARMLGLGYPGGSLLTEFARQGDPGTYPLPVPLEKDPRLAFSFSGLKTAVFYKVREMTKSGVNPLTKQQIHDLATSFELSAIRHLQIMLDRAIEQYQPKMLLLGGGVASSAKVRQGIRRIASKHNISLYYPFSSKLYVDNAAMIAIAGYYKAMRGVFAEKRLDRNPRASIENNN